MTDKKNRDRNEFDREAMAKAAKAYENHEIHKASPCGLRWTLMEKRPDGKLDMNLWAEVVVLASGSLLVHGDFEPSLFSGFSGGDAKATVAWIGADDDIDKACKKASSGLGGSEFAEKLSSEVLLADIADRVDSWEQRTGESMSGEIRDAFDTAIEDASESGDQDDLRAVIMYLINEGAIDSEEACSMGVRTSQRVIMAHALLARLHVLLSKASGS